MLAEWCCIQLLFPLLFILALKISKGTNTVDIQHTDIVDKLKCFSLLLPLDIQNTSSKTVGRGSLPSTMVLLDYLTFNSCRA